MRVGTPKGKLVACDAGDRVLTGKPNVLEQLLSQCRPSWINRECQRQGHQGFLQLRGSLGRWGATAHLPTLSQEPIAG